MSTYVPPMWAEVRVKGWPVWLPLFLVWLLLLPLVLLLLPFVLLFVGPRIVGGLYQALCALKGTEIDVDQADAKIRIVIR